MDSGAYPKKLITYAPVVELADTLDLGSSARAWGFKSLKAHQKRPEGLFLMKKGLEPERAIASERKPKRAFEQQCVQGRKE